MSKGLGYIVDVHDPRDQPLMALGLPAVFPEAFSMQVEVAGVFDQRSSSKCVAFSFAQALRIADKVAGVASPQLSSRDFLYYNSLAYDGGGFVDRGTQLRSCAKGLARFGRPPESVCPFSEDPLVARPSWEAYRQGYDYRGPRAYARVSGLDQIKQALAARKPVVGGALVGSSIEQHMGGLYDPDPNEAKVGGHAMTFVGYDAHSFLLVNSWGRLWSLDGGFVRVSPRFATTFSDCWAIDL